MPNWRPLRTAPQLGAALSELRKVGEEGFVTGATLAALREVADYERAEASRSTIGPLAAKATRLHHLGLSVGPEIRHLLDRIDRQHSYLEEPTATLEVAQQVAALVKAEPVRKAPLVLPLLLKPRVEFSPWPGEMLELWIPQTIWPPGTWTETFAEGLFRKGDPRRFPGKIGIELGTGSGALAIAASMQGAVAVYGTDINPDAALVASLNARMNFVDPSRLHFSHGDLLDGIDPALRADFIFGCIPQVRMGTNTSAARHLLGDVYHGTGNIEDLYGLGLLARALRSAHAHLKPGGWVEFVAAGRPGREMVLELFRRHGYEPEIVHSRRIPQDPDPTMETFAEMEQAGGVRLEFFVDGREGPVSATEAASFPRDKISHDLYVVQGRPYRDLEAAGVRHFLAANRRIGYTEDPGREDPKLREAIAHSYRSATGIGVDPETVFVGPSIQELFAHLVEAMLPAGSTILYSDRNWRRLTPAREWLEGRPGRNGAAHHVTENSLDRIAEEMEKSSAKLVVFNLTLQERSNYAGLKRIAEIAVHKKIRLVMAGIFQRRSESGLYPVARLLQEVPEIAPQLIVIGNLRARYSLARAHLSHAIIRDRALYQALQRLGEVTWSRANTVGQAALLHLMNKTAPSAPAETVVALKAVDGDPTTLNPKLASLAHHPTFLPKSWQHPDPIRLDFGESEHPASQEVVEALGEVADDPAARDLEGEAIRAATEYLRKSRGIEGAQVIAGPGVLGLEAAMIRAIARQGSRPPMVLLPTPYYDVHAPMVIAAGGRPVHLRTRGTKLQAAQIPANGTGPCNSLLVLVQPMNPGGQVYTRNELLAIRRASVGMYLLSDEVFGQTVKQGVRLVSPDSLPPDETAWRGVVTTFGLSKEFSVPGLRAGFAATRDGQLAAAIQAELLTPIDALASGAAGAAFPKWRPIVGNHRQYLATRRRLLEGFLGKAGLPFLPSRGGFSTLVDFSPVYGKSHTGTVLSAKNLANLLDERAGLVIHPPGWAGTDQVRLVYAIDRLPEAMERLGRFLSELTS